MARQGQLQQVFVLHAKPYRDNSLIVDLLTETDGLIKAFARKGKLQNPYQVFTPLTLSLKAGNNELYFVEKLESTGASLALYSNTLYCAYYINEITILLGDNLTDSQYFFQRYQRCLQQLSALENVALLEPILRSFELLLLEEIGALPDLTFDVLLEQPVSPDAYYHLQPDMGIISFYDRKLPAFSGAALLSTVEQNWSDSEIMRQVKVLLRGLIHFHTGGVELKSRKMLKALKQHK